MKTSRRRRIILISQRTTARILPHIAERAYIHTHTHTHTHIHTRARAYIAKKLYVRSSAPAKESARSRIARWISRVRSAAAAPFQRVIYTIDARASEEMDKKGARGC